MLNIHETQLLEKHLASHTSPEEQQQFEQLMEHNPHFAEAAFIEQLIKNAAAEVALNEQLDGNDNDAEMPAFDELLNDIAESHAFELYLHMLNNNEAPQASSHSTTEQLRQAFAPVDAYERVMRSASRSNNNAIEVLRPISGYKADGGKKLQFLLRPAPVSIKLRIENNQQIALIKQTLAPNTTEVDILLDQQLFANGRYYWKLYNADDVVMGEFFVLN